MSDSIRRSSRLLARKSIQEPLSKVSPGQPHQIPLTRKFPKSDRSSSPKSSPKSPRRELEKESIQESLPKPPPLSQKSASSEQSSKTISTIVQEIQRSTSSPLPSIGSNSVVLSFPESPLSSSDSSSTHISTTSQDWPTPDFKEKLTSSKTHFRNRRGKQRSIPLSQIVQTVREVGSNSQISMPVPIFPSSNNSFSHPSQRRQEKPIFSQMLVQHCQKGISKLFPPCNYYEYRIKFPQNETLEHFLNRVFSGFLARYRDYVDINIDSRQTLIVRKIKTQYS